jgi:Fe-S oxidoreductase
MIFERVLLILLLLGSAGLFAYHVDLRWQIVTSVKGTFRTDRPMERIWRFFVDVLCQNKVIRQRFVPGVLHAVVFWGFMVFAGATIEHFLEAFGVSVLGHGTFRMLLNGYTAMWAVLVLVGILGLAYRRFVTRPESLGDHLSVGSGIVAVLISVLMLTYLIALVGPGRGDSTFGFVIWWMHAGAIIAFPPVIVQSKHLHLVLSPFTTYFKDLDLGRIRPLDFEKEEFGAEALKDLDVHTALGAFTCVECGRCHDHCPAVATGKVLDPKEIMLSLRKGMLEDVNQPAVSETVVPEEAIWQCTTCGACTYQCPVGIDQVIPIVEMRRGRVAGGEFPDAWQNFFQNLERRHNPWGHAPHKAEDIIGELELPTYDGQDVLYWMGCLARYDDDYQKVVRAFVGLLRKANVSFGILADERCTGDAARRAGNEFVFQDLAAHNIALLNGAKPKTIITTCPHCLRSLREYEDLGLDAGIEMIHHAEFLDRLIADGKLKPSGGGAQVTYHDPCYLSRYEGQKGVDTPRALLEKAGVRVTETRRHGDTSLCCGAGGGMAFAEEEGHRVNHERVDELLETKPETVATSCPFCPIMIRDGLTFRDQDGVVVKDVAELL